MSDAQKSPSPVTYHHVTVAEAWNETDDLRGLRLDLGPLGAAHTRPGQVVKVHVPGHKEGYFALANAPRADRTGELLLKRGSPLSNAIIAAAQPGATVPVTAPFGDGFPVEHAVGRDVIMFAVGSGITPVRSLLEWLLGRPHGRIALYYGQRSDRDFAYVGEHRGWQEAGVHLVLCASQPSPTWHGARGYVQTVASELRLHEISTDNAVAFLCGMTSMIDGVRLELLRFGLPPERTFLNF
ncbi:MAG: oxidoreductase FAD/NAD(P)-binding domain protein [Myxococcales bacterium]|nr:oxidoreductase FAD/NAD(P)-binding domain protein [Myxococcales bacterium]